MGARGGGGGRGRVGGIGWVGKVEPRTTTGSTPRNFIRTYGNDATFRVVKYGEFNYHVDVKKKGSNTWVDPVGFGTSSLSKAQAKGLVGFLKGIGYKQSNP